MTLDLLAFSFWGSPKIFKLNCPAGIWMCESELEIQIWGKLAETAVDTVHKNEMP